MTNWTDTELLAAWLKTTPITGSTDGFDCDGRRLYADGHGWQWHVDHIIPRELGGTDHPSNLRARHKDGTCKAGGFLGALLRAEPAGILGAFASPPNAMAAAGDDSRPLQRNAMADAMMGFPRLPPHR